MLNPWKVQNIHEFNYYCCPECVFRSKEECFFQVHALQNHLQATSFFHGNLDDLDIEADIELRIKQGIYDYNFKTDLKLRWKRNKFKASSIAKIWTS